MKFNFRNSRLWDIARFRFGKYRGWKSFQSYNPWATTVARIAKRALIAYVILIVVQMIVTWIQMIPLRQEFQAGEQIAICVELPPDEHGIIGLDCGGYYDQIVERRRELQRRNGCGLFGSWDLGDGGEVSGFSVWVSVPVCLKPFPFGSIIEVSAGSVFD